MIEALLESWGALPSAGRHLIFLAGLGTSAALVVAGTAALVWRRSHGGPAIRAMALASSLVTMAAMVLARDLVHLDHYGDLAPTLRWVMAWQIGALGATSLVVGATAASARSALIMAAVHGLASLGSLVYAALLAAVPPGADPSWEVRHFLEFGVFVGGGALALLAVGFASARRQGVGTGLSYALVGAGVLMAMAQGLAHHSDPGLSFLIPAWLPVAAAAAWLAALAARRLAPDGPLPTVGRLARGLNDRLLDHPAALGVVVAAPMLAAALAVLLAGSGSAREASRVSLGGLSITPGLAVPFFFALALGVVLGREQSRWREWSGVALTVAMTGLLLAQKEVGNTAVVLMVAAVAFLVARGTLPHLLAAGGLGTAAVAVAYQLAPVISAIPFTLRERVHLWLGGAELLQRGGHLITASYVGFKVGGFWGLGLDAAPELNLPRLVVALHTDFPLVMLGLYGGWALLSIYIAFFCALAVLLIHTIRTLSFDGDTRRARRQVPLLAGLWAVPVVSTTLNLAGAISQVTPFTGVPVLLVSYSSIFVLGNFGILALFLLVGNRDAQRAAVRQEATAVVEARKQAEGNLVSPEAPADPDQPRSDKAPALTWRQRLHQQWRQLTTPASWALAALRLTRRLRLQRLDQGAMVLMALLPALGGVFSWKIHARYTDDTRYYGHPRVEGAMRVEPPDEEGRWEITQAPEQAMLGPLLPGQRLLLGPTLLTFKQGRLQIIGACFDQDQLRQGVRLGFLGMLDAPELPYGQRIDEVATKRLGARAQTTNDIVLPFGDIASQHLEVRLLESGRVHLRALHPDAVWWPLDQKGRKIEGRVSVIDPGQGFSVGSRLPRRFFIEPREGQGGHCLALRRGALFEYPLASRGPTILGDMTLLRRQLAGRTTDLTFAQDVKLAAEAGLISADGPQGPLRVAPHDPDTRQTWDEETRKRFQRVFQLLRVPTRGGQIREVLAWARPFYADGGRRFDGQRELSAFVIHEDRVLGLADTWRFSRTLPTRYDADDPARNGQLLDRDGQPLTRLDPQQGRVVSTLPGGGALIGVDLRRRGVRDGLLRVFNQMLAGVEPLPDVHRELEDQLAERERGPWGWDVRLTIDREVHQAAFEILRDEIEKLDAREPGTVHHASAVVLGPRNELLALVQMPDTGPLETFEQVQALKTLQREDPLDAPALDALHRRTTLGSTVKLLTMITAFRHKDDVLVRWRDNEWYINAQGDERNAQDGRFTERGGALSSWRGQPLAPIHNYGRSRFGKVVPLRTLLVKSLNTASAYMGLNVGRERYEAFFDDTGLGGTVDLLPPALSRDGQWGHLVDRYYRDSASALPVSIGAIPADEPWTLSLTARLPLSGLSDYSIFSLAAGASVIARGGLYHPPRLVAAIRDRRTGQETRFAPAEPLAIIDPQDAEDIQSYMRDVIAMGTAASYRRGVPDEVWRETGGKTGTGETVIPVDPKAGYDLKNKPRTRDNKSFVAVWPTSSPQPFVVAVIFEQVSHLDGRVAIRASQRIMEEVRTLHATPPPPTPDPKTP